MKTISRFFMVFVLFAFIGCENNELIDNESSNSDVRTPEECVYDGCETGFAVGERCFSEDGISRWGWVVGPIAESDIEDDYNIYEIYAGAGRCNLSAGTLVGHLYVEYFNGTATVTYDAVPGNIFTETHLYVGNEMYPLDRRGRPTVAPGQFPNSEPVCSHTQRYVIEDLSGEIYVIAHSVVCQTGKNIPS